VTDVDIEPVLIPEHEAGVGVATRLSGSGWVITTLAVDIQPALFVTDTVYVPADKLFIVLGPKSPLFV